MAETSFEGVHLGLYTRDSLILVCENGMLSVPGGGRERAKPDETPLQRLTIELREEIDLKVDYVKLFAKSRPINLVIRKEYSSQSGDLKSIHISRLFTPAHKIVWGSEIPENSTRSYVICIPADKFFESCADQDAKLLVTPYETTRFNVFEDKLLYSLNLSDMGLLGDAIKYWHIDLIKALHAFLFMEVRP